MRPSLLLFIILIAGQLFAQTLTLTSGDQVNPEQIKLSGDWELVHSDSTIKLEYKAKNNWKPIPDDSLVVADSLHGSFSFSFNNPWNSDGTHPVSCKLYGDSTDDVIETISIQIKKTKPTLAEDPSFDVNDYISTAQTELIFELSFTDTLEAGKGGVSIFNDSQDTLSLSGTSLTYNGSKVSLTIQESMFTGLHPENWDGATILTVKGFQDTYGNVMEAVEFTGPVVDLVKPAVSSAALNLTVANAATDLVIVTLNFSEQVDSKEGRLTAQSGNDSLNVAFTPDPDSTVIHISKETFVKLQGNWRITVSGIQDMRQNPMDDYTLSDQLLVDTVIPDAPGLSTTNNQIVNNSTLKIEGTKESGATVSVDGKAASGSKSGTSWNYDLTFSADSLYKTEIVQEDAAGNISDAAYFYVEYDNTDPQIGIVPPTLTRKSKDGQDYWELALYFSERVQRAQGNISLSSDEKSFDLNISQITEFGYTQVIEITDNQMITDIDDLVNQNAIIQVSIPAGSFIDRADNPNPALENYTVQYYKENFITDLSAPKSYYSSADSSALPLEIKLRPTAPDNFLISLNVLNEQGESVWKEPDSYNVVGFSSLDTARLDNGVLRFESLNKIIRWELPLKDWNPGRYTVSVSAQEKDFNLAVIPVNFTFYIVNTAPVVAAITPAATPSGHFISRQPHFIVELDPDSSGVSVSNVKIWFEQAANSAGGSPSEQEFSMTEVSNQILEYDCKKYGTYLATGQNKVRINIINEAGLKSTTEYVYYVDDGTVKGIKDFFNYPNPFNPLASERTVITAAYGSKDDLKLYIFDLSGRLVYYRERTNDDPGAGNLRQDFRWDGTDLAGSPVPNGVYLARLKSRKYESKILKIVVNNHK